MTSEATVPGLSEEQMTQFERDGITVLRGVFAPWVEAERDRYDIKHWALEPGDALAFHFLTVHGAPANASQTRRRRGFSARWVGDDATWAVRSGDQTSPPFPQLHEILKHGDALDVPQFPVLWSAT